MSEGSDNPGVLAAESLDDIDRVNILTAKQLDIPNAMQIAASSFSDRIEELTLFLKQKVIEANQKGGQF